MRKIHVPWNDLEPAFGYASLDQTCYLDLETSQIIALPDFDASGTDPKALAIEDNPARYLRLEPPSSKEQYDWLEQFIATIADPVLREKLLLAIDGKGAFRRFKSVLMQYPGERDQYHDFREQKLVTYLRDWFARQELEIDSDWPVARFQFEPAPDVPPPAAAPREPVYRAPPPRGGGLAQSLRDFMLRWLRDNANHYDDPMSTEMVEAMAYDIVAAMSFQAPVPRPRRERDYDAPGGRIPPRPRP